jgi:hypothetical protein
VAPAPTHIRIRSYNVGFGDCFLLTFTYERAKPRNVLIDFGSTMGSTSGPRGGMLEIAEKIKEDCEGKLQMLVATHRHADHISGFAEESGKVIASLDPDLVVQPWTEDPDLDPKAQAPAGSDGGDDRRLTMTSRLSAMQALAEAALAEVPRLEASPAVPKTVADQLRFLGETNLKNLESVRNLAKMGKRRVYANFGTKLPISSLLPGIRIDVLGPPTLEQSSAISHMADKSEDEFWHLAARELGAAGDGRPSSEIFADAATAGRIPQEARWVIPRIDQMQAEEALAIVRVLDGVLNNTSVILLFEIGDSRLLFPGDAQLENWTYALRENDEAAAIRKRLTDVRFYKVGHHGSLNATPKSLWNAFEHIDAKPSPDRLETMVSTAAGLHGSPASGTEVPRKVLIEELTRMSNLHNTQSLKSRDEFWHDVDLDL